MMRRAQLKRKAQLKRTPMRRVSKAKRKQYNEYGKATKEFLKENPLCLICEARKQAPARATEVHHVFLRTGRRLFLDARGWLPSCRACREYPHENPIWAREEGVLALTQDCGRFDALDVMAKSGRLPYWLTKTTVNAS